MFDLELKLRLNLAEPSKKITKNYIVIFNALFLFNTSFAEFTQHLSVLWFSEGLCGFDRDWCPSWTLQETKPTNDQSREKDNDQVAHRVYI